MDVPTFPVSTIRKILADLGVDDPDAVESITITPGHVSVVGFTRDQLDEFATANGQPARWARVFPVDITA